MRTTTRHGYKHVPDLAISFLPRHRGIQVDDKNNPGFWLQIIFDTDDIDAIRGEHIFAVERHVIHESSDLIAICPRLGTAKRIAWQQKPPNGMGWTQQNLDELAGCKMPKGKELKFSITCSDITINVWKMRLSV